MINRVAVFLIACLLSGLGGGLGSIVGHGGGARGLMIGGIVGGLLGATASALVARSRGWIPVDRFRWTAAGACLGFLAAAAVATHTLGSPIGPVLSTLLVGSGALLGAGRNRDRAR